MLAAAGSSGVEAGINIVLTFDEPVQELPHLHSLSLSFSLFLSVDVATQVGTGLITLTPSTGHVTFIPVPDAQVTVAGTMVRLLLGLSLLYWRYSLHHAMS